MRCIVYIFFLLIALACRAGDDPQVRCFGIEQGLSNNNVTCVYQDSRGFMWFGTYDGLNRYDGYGFKVYRTAVGDSHSIPFNNIATLSGDGHGNLWIGGQKGIAVFDPGTARFTVPRYQRCDGSGAVAMQDNVHHLRAAGEGLMLAGTHSDGLIVFEPGGGAGRQIALEGNGEYDVPSIGYDSVRGLVWLFIQKKGLYQYDRRGRRLQLVNDRFRDALSLQLDKKGRVWVGTENGLFLLDADGQGYSASLIPQRCRVVGIDVNSHNDLCIGTDGAGVWKLCAGAAEAEPLVRGAEESLVNSNAAYAVYEDADGRKWIGTLRGGINLIEARKSSFRTIFYDAPGKKDPVSNFILSFCEDAQHNVWIGTDGAGLRYWDRRKNRFTNYVNDPRDAGSISSNFITNLLRDEQDRLWVATWFGGVNRLDRRTGKFVHYSCFNPKAGGEEKHIWMVYQDQAKRIWASATNDGSLYLYNRVSDRFELFDNRIQNLQSMVEDREGVLWGGNYGSLIRIDRERHQHIFYPLGFTVRSLHEDASGQFWVGTQEGGLLCFDRATGKYKRYTTAEGLPGNTILRILEDRHGNLWLSTYNGISEFQRADGKFRNFSPSDGLQSTQFSFNGGLALASGELLFGGIRGFNLFSPDSVLSERKNPRVYLEGVRVQNEAIEADSRFVTRRESEQVKQLTLPFNKAMVSLDFTELSYDGTDKINYAYTLVGWDKGWNYSNGSRTANYSSVHEGSYLFKVRVSHADGTWSREYELMQLVVLPPWYRSWWAYLGYMVCFCAVILGYLRYTRSRERLRYEVKLAQLETEKEKELVAKKVEFFTHITHEFRGPLTLIINPLAEIAAKGEHLQYAYRNAQRLLGLVDQLLLFQKAESGSDVLRPAAVNIVDLAREVWLCFVDAARMKKIRYRFEAPERMEMDEDRAATPGGDGAETRGGKWCLYVDREKVEIAFYNLLSNALKYTPGGGEVVFGLAEYGDGVELFVRDNGTGIPEEVGEQVFDKFYQIRRSEMTSIAGFGIGLYLVRQFVEAHGGTVGYTSAKGKGTCFRVRLPRRKEELAMVKGGDSKGLSPVVREMVEEEVAERGVAAGAPVLGSRLEAGSKSVIVGKGDEMEPAPGTVGQRSSAQLISDKRRVLIVDDDVQLRAYVRHILEDQYFIYEAGSGEEGLEQAQRHRPDLVISDVHMEGISGIELCETIKNDKILAQASVILLTASASANNKLAGVMHGADDYITKPFDKDLLVARVAALLQSRVRVERAFFEGVTNKGAEPGRISEEDKDFLDRLTAVVEENLDEDDFCIRKLSVEMGMSHSHLYQKLKELSGQSLNGFIRYIRLKKAAELLINTDCNVNEAALQVGISDPRYFREQFHKRFGVNPSEYIKRYRKVFSGKYFVNREEL